MIYATAIKMRDKDKDDLLEIYQIFLDYGSSSENSKWYTREAIHNWLNDSKDNEVKVNISPYPKLIPAVSPNGDKYVKSEPDQYKKDNLLRLPRY